MTQIRSGLRWIELDNAAKVYPAAMRRNWAAVFRLSAEMSEPVDNEALSRALKRTVARFPVFKHQLRRGLFWYYLEQNERMPAVAPDVRNPCMRITRKEGLGFQFRVRAYNKRIAVEIFHVLADGTGGLAFMKTLVAEYLTERYGVSIPRGDGILSCDEAPLPEESEDAYKRYARHATRSRAEPPVYRVPGKREPAHVIHLITAEIKADELLERAREKSATLTEYLAAVMLLSLDALQRRSDIKESRMKPVKVMLPVNLRAFFPTRTLRNFSSYVTPGIEPRFGVYTLDEALSAVHHFMGLEMTEKQLNAKFSANIHTENVRILRVMPLFIKKLALMLSYARLGDLTSSTSISNLGVVRLPDEMERYVERIDFILGPPVVNRVTFATISYQGVLRITATRTTRDPALEREFFCALVRLGVHVKVESND